MPSLIRATTLRGFAELVTDLGGDPGELLRRYHFENISNDSDNFIPYRNAVALLETSARLLNCPDFGLRLSAYQGLEILGPVAVIARSAHTVLAACEAIARYLYIHSPALSLTLSDVNGTDALQFNYRINELSLQQNQQAYELSLANGLQLLRLPTAGNVEFCRVAFLHPPLSPIKVYRDVFNCEVLFEQDWCGFQLPRELTEQRINQADKATHDLARAYLDSRFSPATLGLQEQVRALIRQLIATGQCKVGHVAEHLSLHPRTLQRRLAEDGLRFETILDDERKQLALQYLQQPGLYLSQIAGLLGYAEQSAFNRSCRRWFNQTPRALRAGAEPSLK